MKTVHAFAGFDEEGEILDESIDGELASLGKIVHAFADFDEDVSAMDEGLTLILLNDAGRNGSDGDSHVLVLVHGSGQVEVFDVGRHQCALGVVRMLLSRHLAVVMSAVEVLTSPRYWMRLPPTVKRMRSVSTYYGRILVTIRR
jgi:hypothetical protein